MSDYQLPVVQKYIDHIYVIQMPVGQMSYDQMRLGQMFIGQMSVGEVAFNQRTRDLFHYKNIVFPFSSFFLFFVN
jgi:hypothetical protein